MDYSATGSLRTEGADRVRRSTPEYINLKIDHDADARIASMAGGTRQDVDARIAELDQEWDIERLLEVNASTLALTGVLLAATVDKKWLVLPGVVMTFLLQHGLSGWCPPLSIFRRMGFRTRGEINREKYALLGRVNFETAS